MDTDFNNFFTVRTGNLWRIKVKLCLPPHLYFVTALPGKTHTTLISTLHVWFIELMAHNQSYVTVMLNKRPVFDMFTVILPNTFNFFQDHDATRWSYCQWNVAIFFLLGDYCHLQQCWGRSLVNWFEIKIKITQQKSDLKSKSKITSFEVI